MRDGDGRWLVGFDFPNTYPRGFATGLGLSGAPWRAVWEEITGLAAVARYLAERDGQGRLVADLRGPVALTTAERAPVETGEGWILGVGTG